MQKKKQLARHVFSMLFLRMKKLLRPCYHKYIANTQIRSKTAALVCQDVLFIFVNSESGEEQCMTKNGLSYIKTQWYNFSLSWWLCLLTFLIIMYESISSIFLYAHTSVAQRQNKCIFRHLVCICKSWVSLQDSIYIG